ncbi:MAG: LapA family protein [Gammaproteobacteria bacterium]|nr:LapA family protein [Gammaproteobacteria bacterium]MCH9763386.1 LapA family protein [Gammaproteobacteria bacterium]
MRFIMMIFYICLMLFGVSFAALNASAVTLNLYFKTLTLPISVWMIAAFSLGILMGFLVFLRRYLGFKSQYRKKNHQLRLMEKEIKNLREIPLKD